MEIKNFEPNENQRIGSGPYADVYKSGDWAIKIFKEARSKTEIFYEALVNAQIESTGLPIPHVRDVTRLNNKQWVIATQFVNGKTLLDLMNENKNDITKYIDTLIDLQTQIHDKKCHKLVKMKDKLKSEINDTQDIGDTGKFEI